MSDAARHGTGGLAERLGIFARTFPRETPEEVAAAVARAGYPLGHWNVAAVGRSTLAGDVGRAEVAAVRRAFDRAGVAIPSVSATFNVIHPDSERRAAQTAQAVRLIGLVPELGADVVTLCSGTRDPDDLWRAHPGNLASDAWTDLRRTLDALLEAASEAGVRLGIEPEPGNVVRDARTAARLLAELGDDAPVGIVLDPANLLTPETISRQSEILAEAVDLLLGPESPLADRPTARGWLCRSLANPVATELADIMDQAGPAYVRQDGDLDLGYSSPVDGGLEFLPVLPHGGTYGPGG